MNRVEQPFWVIVNKEIRDHVRSWRFIILLAIITLTCLGLCIHHSPVCARLSSPVVWKILFSF